MHQALGIAPDLNFLCNLMIGLLCCVHISRARRDPFLVIAPSLPQVASNKPVLYLCRTLPDKDSASGQLSRLFMMLPSAAPTGAFPATACRQRCRSAECCQGAC